MKRNFKFVLATILTLVTLLPFLSSTQYSPSFIEGFGAYGDVMSGHSQNITTYTTTTSSDWFKPSVKGIGVIDTTGSTGYRTCEPFFNLKIKKDAY